MKDNLIINILVRIIKYIYGENLYPLVNKYILFISNLRKKSGLPYTIKYMKAVKLHITRYMCGKPLLSNKVGVSLTKQGFPKQFLYLKPFLDQGKFNIVLTLLTYSRSIRPKAKEVAKVEPDYSSITDPYKGKQWTIPATFIKKWVLENNLSLNLPKYSDKDHYVSTKAGPLGTSTYNSIWSSRFLSPSQKRWIYELVDKDYRLNIMKIIYLSYLSGIIPRFKTEDNVSLPVGKLAIINDPELKFRIIAMVDYLSQFVLKPIHTGLLSCLKKLSQDRTYTQDPFNEWSLNGDCFYSLDLSAATDRFPVVLQKKLLGYLYQDFKFANNWSNLLTKRGFWSKQLQRVLYYSVGQPMGCYSSWAAFTLAHHLVVAYAAHRVGISNFKDYIILGDDIVIKNNKVALKYIQLMEKLGVEISMHKTHVSKDTYEFAKRWIRQGKEITGLPLKGLLHNWNDPRIVFLEIWNYLNRIPISKFSSLDLVCLLYNKLPFGQKKRVKSLKQMNNLLYDFNHTIRYTAGLVTYDELRSFMCRKMSGSIAMVPTERIIPSFLRALSAVGLIKEASNTQKMILKSVTQFDDWFKAFMLEFKSDKQEYLKLIHRSVSSYPLYIAYRWKIEKSLQLIRDFFDSSMKLELQDVLMELQYEEFDKIVALHRKTVHKYYILSKVWNNAFKVLFYKDPLFLQRFLKIQKALKEGQAKR